MTKPRVLLIDHYDSFTHNLAQQVWMTGAECDVKAHDQLNFDDLSSGYTHFILSPGPGHPAHPKDFSISALLLKRLKERPFSQPLFGVCLGHQGLALAFGAEITYAPKVMHGKESIIAHTGDGLFLGLPPKVSVMRYHSLCVKDDGLPSCFKVVARSIDDQVIMALAHIEFPIFSVQFHPESIATPYGGVLMKNFLMVTPIPGLSPL